MTGNEIQAKSILRTHRRIDSWFVSRYGMNLYRGCFHDCVYCDGRAEKYQVEGDFGRHVEIKTNALALLERELGPGRRQALQPSFVMVGGGVNDSYQPAERQYRLTRGALDLLYRSGQAVLVLTKSPFVKEDRDLLVRINERRRAILGMSFSGVDKDISRIFEPTVAAPAIRLDTLRYFKDAGLACAMFLMPVLPYITDSAEQIEASLYAAKAAGVDYVVFSGLTLKTGRQMEHFVDTIRANRPDLVAAYERLYASGGDWGGAPQNYYDEIQHRFHLAAVKVGIPVRMPLRLFADILRPRDKAVVLLEHIDYMLKLRGAVSRYGYAAHVLSDMPEREPRLDASGALDLPGLLDPQEPIRHAGRVSANPYGPHNDGRAEATQSLDSQSQALIEEIFATGTCRLYEKLVADYKKTR